MADPIMPASFDPTRTEYAIVAKQIGGRTYKVVNLGTILQFDPQTDGLLVANKPYITEELLAAIQAAGCVLMRAPAVYKSQVPDLPDADMTSQQRTELMANIEKAVIPVKFVRAYGARQNHG